MMEVPWALNNSPKALNIIHERGSLNQDLAYVFKPLRSPAS